nr:hypothetical protein [Candidatus Brachybacter algidus]
MSTLFRKKSIAKILIDAESGLSDSHGIGLKKVLGVKDLTALGIAAVIGAGVFSSIGKASFDGGPGVMFLYILRLLLVDLRHCVMQSLHLLFLYQAAPIHILM